MSTPPPAPFAYIPAIPQNGVALTMKRALESDGGDDGMDPGANCRQDVCTAIAITTVLVMGIAFAVSSPGGFGLIGLTMCLAFSGTVVVFWWLKRRHMSSVDKRSINAVFRNCRLVVLAEAERDSDGRMPTAPEDFDFTLQSYGKSGTLCIVSSRELATIRIIQLLKFADPRAAVYLDTPPGQALLETLLPTATEAIAVAV